MPFNRGRPRTRPPVRRMTVEVDEVLFGLVEVAAGASPFRVVVEEALQLWLENKESGSPMPDLQRMEREHRLRQQAELSPPTPSDGPRGHT
jgi:hypothetical protein